MLRAGMEAANLRPNETMPSADGGSGQTCPISYSPNSRKERLPTLHKSRIANAEIGALEKHVCADSDLPHASQVPCSLGTGSRQPE